MLAEREKTIFSLTDVTADHEIRARLERAATAAEDCTPGKCSIKDIFCKTNSFSFHFNTHLLQ